MQEPKIRATHDEWAKALMKSMADIKAKERAMAGKRIYPHQSKTLANAGTR